MTAIRSPWQLQKGFSLFFSLSSFTVYPPQSYRQIQRTIKGNITRSFLMTCADESGKERGNRSKRLVCVPECEFNCHFEMIERV